MSKLPHDAQAPLRWYQGISRYQWLVLVIASLGWVFDIFEGQIFVAAEREIGPALLGADASDGQRELFKNVSFATFLLGGAVGGIVFGRLSDRYGRTRIMIVTILVYSVFTALSAAVQATWQMYICRFLVALGVGGEWAVASALVAEVFPKRARAWSLSIFHASSVFGTLLAVAAGTFLVGNPSIGWRWAFVVGVLPALLILWIRMSLKEPEGWKNAQAQAAAGSALPLGRIADLFAGGLRRHTLVGLSLAAVGMATFWGVHVNGKNVLARRAEVDAIATLARLPNTERAQIFDRIRTQWNEQTADPAARERMVRTLDTVAAQLPQHDFATIAQNLKSPGMPIAEQQQLEQDLSQVRQALLAPQRPKIKDWEMLGMLLVTLGGGIGLVSFGPISEWLGRRGAFLFYHLGGLTASLALFLLLADESTTIICAALPLFGFLTLGMHAGYAIYFPELFPTRLRGTGGGFCFNGGRVIAAPILYLAGWMQSGLGFSLTEASSLLSGLFLLGLLVLVFAPETRGSDLP